MFSILTFLGVSTTFWVVVLAQTDCTSVLIKMSPCLNYIQGNTSTPSLSCCSQLANVVKWSPICLCQVLNGGADSLGVKVNHTQALAMPAACKVQTPPQSQCNSSSSPSGSPSTDNPSGSGSPTKNGDSYFSKFSISSLLFALVFMIFFII